MSNLSTASNTLHALYVQSITDLAQSIVVKFDTIAKGVNNAVLLKTGELADPANPASWKYFQNICGQYHFSDTPMTVYSLDSESTIDFTVAELQNNPVTRAAYAFGSNYYDALLAAYPDQEMLILGILYPADMQTAIDAKDGTILAHPTHLVEDSEVDFLRILQAWTYANVRRWFNAAYTITDDLYMATFFGQFTLHLIGIISNIRLAACKTNQAHSFHIKQYLRSHGFLDNYLNQMSRKQALDMYRNINYYERNAGYESTFEQLIKVVFSDASLPAYSYEMLHNQESIKHELATDTEQLLPVAHFRRVPLNDLARAYPLASINLTQLHTASADQTPYNDAYQTAHVDEISQNLARSPRSSLPTKVIECAINPIGSPSSQTPDSILFTHWIDWVAQDRYSVPVEFVPEGAETPIRLSHQQAVAVWIYAVHKAMEPDNDLSYPYLTRVPPIRLMRALRVPKPSVDDLAAVVSSAYISRTTLTAILATAPTVPDVVGSLAQFRRICSSIYLGSIKQFNLYSFNQQPQSRGQAQAAVDRLYCDKVVRLSNDDVVDSQDHSLGIEYSTLLQKLGFNFNGYRPIDYYNTAARLMAVATGSDLSSLTDPTNIQGAMVSLLRYLSSYSIQILSSGASSNRIVAAHPDVRVSNYLAQTRTLMQADLKYITLPHLKVAEGFKSRLMLEHMPSTKLTSFVLNSYDKIRANAIGNGSFKSTGLRHSNMPSGLTFQSSGFDPATVFWSYTADQRQQLVDVPLITSVESVGPTSERGWLQTAASQFWYGCASSADGMKLVAVDAGFGYIWTSTNGGASWSQQSSLFANWNGCASSADGVKLVAVDQSGFIWTSTDSGFSWVQRGVSRAWIGCASSTDGVNLIAIENGIGDGNGGSIWTSSDSGANWTPRITSTTWYSCASSADGVKLIAVEAGVNNSGGYIWTSTDSGVSWAQKATAKVWTGCTSSADGVKLVATEAGDSFNGHIWTSGDSGDSWIQRAIALGWTSCASSADGAKLVALELPADNLGQIWQSSDSGVTWSESLNPKSTVWTSCASSADGSKLIATEIGIDQNGGYIWTY